MKLLKLSSINAVLTNIKVWIMSFMPRRFPLGVTEFHVWADRIIKQVGPIAEVDSMKFVLATEMLRLEGVAKTFAGRMLQFLDRSDRAFIKILHIAAAKQVAGAVFQEIKLKRQAAEVTSAPTNEATPIPVASNDQKI